MEKVIDFTDTEFAKDVLNPDPKIVFNSKNTKQYESFKFDLFGDIITVRFFDNVYSKDDPDMWIFGNCNFADQVINLSTKSISGEPLSRNQIRQTFVHECVHLMLESGQFYEESYNEALVEWLAKCINKLFVSKISLVKRFK